MSAIEHHPAYQSVHIVDSYGKPVEIPECTIFDPNKLPMIPLRPVVRLTRWQRFKERVRRMTRRR